MVCISFVQTVPEIVRKIAGTVPVIALFKYDWNCINKHVSNMTGNCMQYGLIIPNMTGNCIKYGLIIPNMAGNYIKYGFIVPNTAGSIQTVARTEPTMTALHQLWFSDLCVIADTNKSALCSERYIYLRGCINTHIYRDWGVSTVG